MTMTNGGGPTPRATTGAGAAAPPVPPSGAMPAALTQPGSTKPGSTQEKAAWAKDAAAHGARDVAQQTGRQTKELARDAMGEMRTVVDRARGEAVDHADTQATKAAGGMRQLSEQLRALAEGRPEQAGRAGQFTRDAIEPLQRWADSLEQGGITGLGEEAARLARRRPGMFLAACAGLGFVSGRAVKATRAVSHDANGSSEMPMTGGYPAVAHTEQVYAPSGAYGTTTTRLAAPGDAGDVTPTDLGVAEPLFDADVDPTFAPSTSTDVPPAVIDPAAGRPAPRGTRGR